MAKELIGFYKADAMSEDDLIARLFADIIKQGHIKSAEGLEPEIAEKVKKLLEEDDER